MLYDIKPLTSEPPGYGFAAAEVGNGGNRSTERLNEPGVAATGCTGAFSVSRDGSNFVVAGGMIGTVAKGTTTIAVFTNGYIYAEIDMDGEDGTYTAAINSGTPLPTGSATKAVVTIAVVTDSVAAQSHCGDIGVTVCRNWYASATPYFTFSAG